MEWMDLIIEKGLPAVPALIVVGAIVKEIRCIPDRFIPLILLPLGIAAGILSAGFSAEGVIQGVLLAGAAVYGNQAYRQLKEKKS